MNKLPPGWRLQRNPDGSLGLFAPKPEGSESKRTSECFYPGARPDGEEIMFKFFTHLIEEERFQLTHRLAMLEIELSAIEKEDSTSPLRQYCEEESRKHLQPFFDAFGTNQPKTRKERLKDSVTEVRRKLKELP